MRLYDFTISITFIWSFTLWIAYFSLGIAYIVKTLMQDKMKKLHGYKKIVAMILDLFLVFVAPFFLMTSILGKTVDSQLYLMDEEVEKSAVVVSENKNNALVQLEESEDLIELDNRLYEVSTGDDLTIAKYSQENNYYVKKINGQMIMQEANRYVILIYMIVVLWGYGYITKNSKTAINISRARILSGFLFYWPIISTLIAIIAAKVKFLRRIYMIQWGIGIFFITATSLRLWFEVEYKYVLRLDEKNEN